MTRVPVRVPRDVGVKVIEKVQEAAFASVSGANGQLLVCAKSPATEIDVIVRGAAWRFFKLIAFAPLVVFTIWPENDSELDDKVTGGPPGALSDTV
jgi:hypothetical protein